MSLDACPSNDELLRIKAERERRVHAMMAEDYDARRPDAGRPTAKPRKVITPTEHVEQCRLFEWIDGNQKKGVLGYRDVFPEFGFIFAVPNGAYRSPAVAGKSKAEGQRPGYADIGWDLARGHYTGFRGELKRIGGGALSPLQQEWHVWYERQELYVCTTHGWEAMRDELLTYFNLSTPLEDTP